MSHRLTCLALALVFAAACHKAPAPAATVAQRGEPCSTTALCTTGFICTDAPAGLPATPGKPTCNAPARHYTFHAIAGGSMGAIGSSLLVAQRPDLFDGAGMLGGPFDGPLLTHNIEVSQLGGFCTSAQLEAALALDIADHGNRLDTPGAIAGCAEANVRPVTPYSRAQRFNHWAFTTSGAVFDRDSYIDIFTDLTLAFGNPFSNNPNSPMLANPLTVAQYSAADCDHPAIFPHFIDAKYNPTGAHDAITFCDGEPPHYICADDTLVDWCQAAALNGRQVANVGDATAFCATHGGNPHEANRNSSDSKEVDTYFAQRGAAAGCYPGHRKVPFALAIDLNGNGRRDYNEPIVQQGHEPFQDVGADGCPDAFEDGKGGCVTNPALSPFASGKADPNGDNYDPATNPKGTEGNYVYDLGEPFEDTGLDQVAGTHDVGEADGKFTVAEGYAHWFAQDLHTQLPHFSAERKAGLNLYVEGGIRDVFDLGAQAWEMSGAVEANLSTPFNRFADFPDIPAANGLPWNYSAPNTDVETDFNPLAIDTAAIGPNALVLYGNPNASVEQIRQGNGDHLGTYSETYDRFVVFFQWLSQRWDPVLGAPAAFDGTPTVEKDLVLDSTALGAKWNYSIVLPPGYNDPANANRRYPVVVLLHGYGMTAQGMAGTGSVANVLATQGLIHPIIGVFPSGICCLNGPNGERTCRATDDSGASYQSQGYTPECVTGTFFVDRQGETGTDKTPYAQALYELMAKVDGDYRTLVPVDGQAY